MSIILCQTSTVNCQEILIDTKSGSIDFLNFDILFLKENSQITSIKEGIHRI